MSSYDEYCYNLMEAAIKGGAENQGLSKEACTAYMNMMMGVREYEEYTNISKGEVIYGEEMGD